MFVFASIFLLLIVVQLVAPTVTAKARTAVMDRVAPIVAAFAAPVDSLRFAFSTIASYEQLRRDNIALRHQVDQLSRWKGVALSYEQNFIALSNAMNATRDWRLQFSTARIFSDQSSAYQRSVLLDYGSADGAQLGQALMSKDGVIGRLTEIGEKSSRAILITDLSSKIPATIDNIAVPALLIGTNGTTLQLDLLNNENVFSLSEGMKIYTSGQGGVYPAGLLLGYISSIKDDVISVQSFVDWRQINYVQALHYRKPKWLFDE